jgi:hypothetical protein
MHHKTKAEPWTWIPADSPSRRLRRMLGAMVLAVAFLTAGVVIGRMSVVDLAPRAENRLSSAAEPSPSLASQPPPARAASKSAERQPTMALKSEIAPEDQGSSAAASPPNPAVLLNPGTVRTHDYTEGPAKGSIPTIRGPATMVDQAAGDSNPGNAASADNRNNPPYGPANSKTQGGAGTRVRWKRAVAKPQLARPTEQSALSAPAPSVSRDYKDLRAYMLTR